MAKYIDADKMLVDESDAYLSAQAKITDKVTRDINYVVHTKLQRLLADAPAADVAEVRHGRWENDGHTLACSNCHTINIRGVAWDYCPNCGASMLDRDINVLNKSGAKMDEPDDTKSDAIKETIK